MHMSVLRSLPLVCWKLSILKRFVSQTTFKVSSHLNETWYTWSLVSVDVHSVLHNGVQRCAPFHVLIDTVSYFQ